MTSLRFWLGSALCGALLVAGCSNGGNGDGGAGGGNSGSTIGSNTAASSSGTGTSSGTSTGTSTGSSTGTGTTTGAPTSSTGSSTGAPNLIGVACDSTAMPDTVCMPSGYECDAASMTCQLPSVLKPCNVTVGCATGLKCTSGLGAVPVCLQPCATTNDCTDTTTHCAPVGATGQSACLPNGCTHAYTTCDAGASNDGTCYPAQLNTVLYCEQAGPVPKNQPCGSNRVDGGLDQLCDLDSLCISFGTNGTACLPLCAAGAPSYPDGGPGCNAGSVCAALETPPTLGTCLQGCMNAAQCPAPLTQCVPLGGLTGSFCIP